MKREMKSVLCGIALGFTLSWEVACGGAFSGRGAEGSDGSGEQPLANACAGTQGTGTYKGYDCSSQEFVATENLTCAEAQQHCLTDANANPDGSVLCTWNDRLLYRRDASAGACDARVCSSVAGVGEYRAYTCPSYNTIFIQLSTCQSALSNCQYNASSNPNSSVYCTWKGTEIFRREKTAGSCPH